MIRVVLTANLQNYYPSRDFQIEASDIKDLLQKMDLVRPLFSTYVVDENWVVRKHVNFFVDGQMIRKDKIFEPLRGGATVHIMQALSGG